MKKCFLIVMVITVYAILCILSCKDTNPSGTTSLQPPTLSSPTDGATDQSVTPTMVWTAVVEADTYHIQVSTNNSFTDIFIEDSTLDSTSKYFAGFGFNALYYWRVRAKNESGASAWTTTWNFTTTSPISDPAELEGVWDGGCNADTNKWRYTFTSDSVVILQNLNEFYKGHFVLDTTSYPKAIDVHITWSTDAEAVGTTILSLYEHVAGDNILNIRYNDPGLPRPQYVDWPIIQLIWIAGLP